MLPLFLGCRRRKYVLVFEVVPIEKKSERYHAISLLLLLIFNIFIIICKTNEHLLLINYCR